MAKVCSTFKGHLQAVNNDHRGFIELWGWSRLKRKNHRRFEKDISKNKDVVPLYLEKFQLRTNTVRTLYVPSGSGISERNHRSIKTLAVRKRCSVAEAVYRYVMPRSDDQASNPMETLFNYLLRECPM